MSFETSTTLPSLTYSATLILSSYLIYRGFTPPNPPPKRVRPVQDSLGTNTTIFLVGVYKYWVVSSGLLQAFYSIFRPTESSLLCPASDNLTWSLFEWNQFTTPLALMVVGGGWIRVLAYAQLGGNFTYELATPSGLVTGGLYRYAQHPSYTGAYIYCIGMLPLISRFDAGYGCFTPSILQIPLTASTWIWIGFIFGVRFPQRVFEEEDMMRKNFGAEWEEYHKRTCRFLPGLF